MELNKMELKQNTEKSETHLRVHGKEGFILCLDLNVNPKDVISHLIEHYNMGL